jgi:hypothetical protein
MPGDRSRRTDGLRDSYTGVVAQQGRVTLDRDFNAEHGYLAGRIEAEACDVIGPCGTPDNGFEIGILQTSPPSPPFWSPPAPLSPPIEHLGDFLIGPGTMYVGGQRAVLEARPAGHPVTYSYFDQPDLIAREAGSVVEVIRNRGRELVFLALTEQEVGAVEDPDLLEVALGGPDTTQRLRLLRQVRRETVQGPDCTTAWDEAVALWRARDGLILDARTMRLWPEARLLVSFSGTGGAADPCDPIAQNGYLGAENQTIRVRISDTGTGGSPSGQAKLLWGYDNASFEYRAAPLASNPAMLTISPLPPDSFHIPQAGQAVEILRTVAVLGSEPDMTDPTGQRAITRCVARSTGVVRRLTQPYGPVTPGDPSSYIVLDEALPAEFLGDTTPLFMRVWQSEIAFDASGDTVLLTDDVTGASTGVEVTISLQKGDVLTLGAYWLLAVRPTTPQAVYPERLLTAPQPPDGPRLWACPLAVIDWANIENPAITDCRIPFDPLTGVTGRRSGCCTVSISPADLAKGISLQAAIDRAAKLEAGATVCLAPGVYTLTSPLHLTAAHAGITIEACGGGATLAVVAGNEAAFTDGMVVATGANNVTIRGLTIVPAMAPLPASIPGFLAVEFSSIISAAILRRIETDMRVLIGVRAWDSQNLVLADCTVQFAPAPNIKTQDVFGVGLFAQGNCAGLTVRDCDFASTIAPTFTRVTLQAQTGALAPRSLATVTSPPGLVPQTLDRVLTSFGTLVANVETAEAVIAREAVVVTAGCLAVLNIDLATGASNGCELGNAALDDNTFSDLTMALFGETDAGTLRLRDNSVKQCVAGLWLLLTNWQDPSDPKALQLFNEVWTAAIAFEEFLLLDVIGSIYPLPQGSISGQPPAVSGPTSLFINGNQIEPVFQTNIGSSGLVILGNRPVSTTADTSVSLLISGNRLRGRSGPTAATALLLVPEQERCAITGNVILSESASAADPGPSLWLVPDSLDRGTELLSVVGNVLQGRSDLSSLLRAGVVPAQSWALYNAMP